MRSRFAGTVKFGCGREWEFATKAVAASVAEPLVSLGNAVWSITGQSVEEMAQAALEKEFQFETPKWMGIHEIHLIRPRCVISSIRNNTIINMLPNRDKKTVTNYLYNLTGKEEVQYVAMDMWTPYRDAVQAALPDARIVIDKFHVVRMANDALEKIRKGLRSELTLKQKRGLMHDRFVLLKRERDLTDQERLLMDGWTKNYPVLGLAYKLKEDFYGIYEGSGSPEEAMRRYEAWNRSVTPDVREAFSDLIRAWTNWQPWIIDDIMGRRGIPDDAIGYGVSDMVVAEPKPYPFKEPSTRKPKNYEADINTLIELLEAGKL